MHAQCVIMYVEHALHQHVLVVCHCKYILTTCKCAYTTCQHTCTICQFGCTTCHHASPTCHTPACKAIILYTNCRRKMLYTDMQVQIAIHPVCICSMPACTQEYTYVLVCIHEMLACCIDMCWCDTCMLHMNVAHVHAGITFQKLVLA